MTEALTLVEQLEYLQPGHVFETVLVNSDSLVKVIAKRSPLVGRNLVSIRLALHEPLVLIVWAKQS